MNLPSRRARALLLIAASSFLSCRAAAGDCTVTSVTLAPPAYTGIADTATGAVNWTCSRVSATVDGASITFNTSADNGAYYTTSPNLNNGGSNLPYSLTGTSQVITAGFSKNQNSVSGSFTFSFAIAPGLSPSAGTTYVDSLLFGGTCTTKKGTTCTVTPATLVISVDVTPKCAVSAPPVDLTFAYMSFQSVQAVANSPYTVNCTTNTPYTMGVSPTNGSLLGLPYLLTLGTSANSATDISGASYTGTGTSAGATYFINGSIVQGLAGSCNGGSCSASAPHTLTISY